MEILVIFLMALYWCLWRRSRPVVKDASVAWFRHIRKSLLIHWTHLGLLAVVGNGLIEAVAHQGARSSQFTSFYNYSHLYVILSIMVWFSSVLQQVAYAIAEIDYCYEKALQEGASENEEACTDPNPDPPATPAETIQVQSTPLPTSMLTALKAKLGLNDDWKWQPIAAQAGILFCLWGLLTYSSEDTKTGAVFGFIVSAACPWSGLYASKVIVRAFPWILKKVYKNLLERRRNYRGPLPLLHPQRWPSRRSGARHSVDEPQDSDAIPELVEISNGVHTERA